MNAIEDYQKEIEIYSKEEHELHQQIGLSIARNLQKKQEKKLLQQSTYILNLVYCHFDASN